MTNVGTGVNSDQLGHSPFHCSPVRLNFAITPYVGDSGALFLSVGSLNVLTPIIKLRTDYLSSNLKDSIVISF